MATTQPGDYSKTSPQTQITAVIPPSVRPLASIFTKEGCTLLLLKFPLPQGCLSLGTIGLTVRTPVSVKKCSEQQSVQRPKRSRPQKSEPIVTSSSASPTELDPSEEAAAEFPGPKSRSRPETRLAAPPAGRRSKSRRGKRKKKDEDEVELEELATEIDPSAHSTRVALQADRQCSTTRASDVVTEAGHEARVETVVEGVSEITVDPNYSRWKRRKKSLNNQFGGLASSTGSQEADDLCMEDSPSTDLVPPHNSVPIYTHAVTMVAPELASGPMSLQSSTTNDVAPVQSCTLELLGTSEVHRPLPSLKPLHPFFTATGLKKMEVISEEKLAPETRAKTIHPFFAPGGMKKLRSVENEVKSDVRPSTQTPNNMSQVESEPKSIPVNTSSGITMFSLPRPTPRNPLRIPGGLETPWPRKDQRHVRQLSAFADFGPQAGSNPIPYPNERKLKTRRVEVTTAEDILGSQAKSLNISHCKKGLLRPNYHQDEYFRVPSTLRLPTRHILTGSQLQEQVRRRTLARLPFPGEKIQNDREGSASSFDSEECGPKKIHPALTRLYDAIHKNLTPFDVGSHETQLWTQKYAPQHSEQVLQVGREIEVLRDWVRKLIVDTSSGVSKKKRTTKAKDNLIKGGNKKKKKKKKRTRGDGLDDFLIEEDEELDEMDEIPDPDDNHDTASSGTLGPQVKKSTIRTGDKNASITAQFGDTRGTKGSDNAQTINAVVICGPHGCGKTAAVYAVAKEMGFTVFEVNPGSRRSGKDILDQVGEMSKNHLVHQQKAKNVDGTLFFQRCSRNGKPMVDGPEKTHQMQSLILLEEVDLLFEEDKQFWPTVMTLIGQSKRPIIMTCNDESLLPMDELPLYAILRFSPPPEDLTIDYLLLLAANEGHLLQQAGVAQMYHALHGDLRASITELNFWCQMGIGDRRAGLDWILTRFPTGCDMDDDGEMRRVVSEDTYIGGMGLVPQEEQDDGLSTPACVGRKLREEDMWRIVFEEWEIDVGGDAVGPMRRMDRWTEGINGLKSYEHKQLASQAVAVYTEALSDVDVYGLSGMRTLENPILDMTQPPLPPSIHADYVLGYPLLQTDVWPAFPVCRNTFTSISATIRSLARLYLASETNALLEPQQALEPIGVPHIISSISGRALISQDTAPMPTSYIRDAFAHLAQPAAKAVSSLSAPSSVHWGTIATTSVHGPSSDLVLDIAPYARAVVRYDLKMEEERLKKVNALLLQGGAGGRRSTRAARLAMEGGSRSRQQRWFERGNRRWMLQTGGDSWGAAVDEVFNTRKEEGEEGGRREEGRTLS